MVSDGSVPWYNSPARPFPAKDWLRRRYGFLVPASAFARYQQPRGPLGRERDFPAKTWADARRITNRRNVALSS